MFYRVKIFQYDCNTGDSSFLAYVTPGSYDFWSDAVLVKLPSAALGAGIDKDDIVNVWATLRVFSYDTAIGSRSRGTTRRRVSVCLARRTRRDRPSTDQGVRVDRRQGGRWEAGVDPRKPHGDRSSDHIFAGSALHERLRRCEVIEKIGGRSGEVALAPHRKPISGAYTYCCALHGGVAPPRDRRSDCRTS